jgi:pilus assembly protein CpaC
MIKKIFVACLLLVMTNVCLATERIELYIGEIKILELAGIERIAVGNPAIVSNSILNNGQLILFAEAEGSSNVHIWFNNGSETDYMVHVTAQTDNLVKRKIEVENLVSDIEGLQVDLVGDRIILSGLVDFGHEETIKSIQDAYEDVLVSTNFAVNTLVRKKLEVEDLLSDLDGLNVRIVGANIVLTGLIDSGYEEAITTVKTAFPDVMDLTQRGSLDINMPGNKMVLMNIKITEFNKSYAETLGIEWTTTVAGPAAAVAFDSATNSLFRAEELPATSFGSDLGPGDAVAAVGYFGIVSEITSRINFAVNSGNLIILAEPRLSARSGGEASFLAGGEFPIEISNINGTTIEFKEYGIQLSVKPEVDLNNNVRAKVTTEISSLDRSVAIDGVPGLLTRKTDADVILRSGETLVMSGLISQEAGKDITGVKWLKDIPILGKLFSSEAYRDNKSELVIFVTPEVFNANSEINKKAQQYSREGIGRTIKAMDEDSLDIVY